MIEREGKDRREEALVDAIRAAGRPLSVGDAMHRAQIHPGERTAVKRALRELIREGRIVRTGKRFSIAGGVPAPAAPARIVGGRRTAGRGGRGVLGTFTRARGGFGFVSRADRQGEDVFVPRDEAAKAVDGDLVRVEVVPGTRGRSAGRIVQVVERRRRILLGTYHARGRSSFVVPSDQAVEGYVAVPASGLARDGEVVKVAVSPGPRLEGQIVERVGNPGDPRVEVLRIAYAKGFSDVFPDDVLEEAEQVPDRVRSEDWNGRRDFTDLRLVTIDGEDARDFDDAVHVERLPGHGRHRGGYRLVVAIADVSHYVRPGMALDAEALRRGTSVYFPMQVLPMLPERLSNGICSLNPEVDRLCIAADLRIDSHGEPVDAQIHPAVMRSAARCTYTEVARVLSGERVPHREFLRADLELMAELQEKLTEMRRRRGSIDFDLPEAKIVLGEEGLSTSGPGSVRPEPLGAGGVEGREPYARGARVLGIEKRPRNRAHRVVEEFMLAANEAVARHFGERQLPTIYRVHGLPDEEKLAAFLDLARAHGFEVGESLGQGALNALLARFGGHAQQRALNQLLLRAMMQAVYSPENIGHYGLAAEHYVHFTSPIRRYPDLVVHRLLQEERAGPRRRHPPFTPSAAGREAEQSRRAPLDSGPAPQTLRSRRTSFAGAELDEVALVSSERERAAMQAEREAAAFYAALFMLDKVGQRFRGVVASVVEFGLFVELQKWYVEGLVKVEDLGEGFELDPRAHALIDRRSGRAFRVGDEVEVEVLSASPVRRQIDLALVEAGRARLAPRRGRREEEKEGAKLPGHPSRPVRPPRRKPQRGKGGRRGR
jgi:ribonuclease R